MGFVNELREDGEWQTIDRKRDIILRYIGGESLQEPKRFEIKIKSVKIRFDALQTKQIQQTGKIEVTWDITKIYLHSALWKDDKKIKNIKEALHALSFADSPDLVEIVHVNFNYKKRD